jgi:hypothetical protein
VRTAGSCAKKRIESRSGKVNIEEWAVCNNKKTTTFVIGGTHGQHKIRLRIPRSGRNRERVILPA